LLEKSDGLEREKVEYLTTTQVSKRLGLKDSDDVSVLIRNNQLPNAIKKGHRWRIPISDLNKYEKGLNENDSCLTIKQATERLGYKSGNGTSIIDLIKKSILPNAFKSNGRWWIPENDIKDIEEKKSGSLDTKQACQRLGLKSAHYVSVLINKNTFPNAFKDYIGSWRIPFGDIEDYEKVLNISNDIEMTVGLNEAAKMLGFKSVEAMSYHLKKNRFPNAYKFKNSWRISINDIESFLSKVNVSGCLSTVQAAERLGYKAAFSINQLIKKSILPDAFKINGKWWIPISNIEEIEKQQSGLLDTKQVAKRLNLKSDIVVAGLISKNKFPNAYKDVFNKWRIPIEDIREFDRNNNTDNSIDLEEAAKRLGYQSLTKVRKLLEGDYFPNAYKSGRKIWIPLTDFEEIQKDFFKKEQLEKGTHKDRELKKEKPKLVEFEVNTQGYLDIVDAEIVLKVSKEKLLRKIQKGEFSNVFKYKGKWWIFETDIEEYQKEIKEIEERVSGTLSVVEVADRLGYANQGTLSPMITKQNKFPNAFKVEGSWRIPVTDVEEFEESIRKVEYTPEMALAELKSFIEAVKISGKLKETKELYISFIFLQINKMSGSIRHKKNRAHLFMRLYEKLMNTIENEVFLVSTDVLSELLGGNSELRQHEKKILIVFLRYAYHKKSIEPEQEFSLMNNPGKVRSKEVYSPELFHEIYQYVKNLENRTQHALKDRSYANMWTYTILLLTDFIRGQDLIQNTPNIDLEIVGINSLDWFNENEVSEFQAQSIINQLYTHFRYKRASKTDELLTFIVAPDLIASLATALIISELHRRLRDSELLLDTFMQGTFNSIRTEGKISHRNFFNEMKAVSEFKFSSRLMNRSVATYLFYAVTEEDGQDSDLALHLTQVSRSHKSPDTTSQYIQATNKDGSINRVSYNLFKRGHFGWLYNYLILYVSQFEGSQDTLEERSNLVEQVRQEITPYELENVARFVNDSMVPVPLKNHSDSMGTFLQSIYKKRQSLVSKLKEYSKEEIREIITKLANGDLQSKNEHAQCLVFPNCKNPKLSNCFSCEYVIPGNLMLIQLNEELNRLVDNIDKTTNEVILQRESRFLMHTLFIWKEARVEYGDDRVKAYIDLEETWKKIESVAHKILVE